MFLLPPPRSLTDSQDDILGFPRPPSPLLQSPQLSQISPFPVQTPQVDAIWHAPLLDTVTFPSKLEFEAISPYILDDSSYVSLDRHSGWPLVNPHSYQVPPDDHRTPFFPFDYPGMTEFDGSTSSISASPAVLTPVSARIAWLTLM